MNTQNIREITKKEKFKGLTKTSWMLASIISGGFYPYIVFYSFLVFVSMIFVFYVVEFFDDDIVEIWINGLKHKGKDSYHA